MRNFQEIPNEKRKAVKYGIQTISSRTPFPSANLPNEYKLGTSLHVFKVKIKNWHYDECALMVIPTFSAKFRVFIKLLS